MQSKPRGLWAALVLGTALLVVVAIELTLHVLAFVSPQVARVLASPFADDGSTPRQLPDERFEFLPNPAFHDHDLKGYRNPERPTEVDVVALGDSQTYGVGVAAADAWPRRLEGATGSSVYSMAYGGYGPTDSLMLWEEAMALGPSRVIEAFYAGNDLYDCFDTVYHRGQLAELRSSEPDVAENIAAAEKGGSIADRAEKLFRLADVRPARTPADPKPQPRGRSALSLLSEHSRMYGLVRRMRFVTEQALRTRSRWPDARSVAERYPDRREIFDDGQFRTIFTSAYRLLALDLEDPRIAEGFELAKRAILEMQRRASTAGIDFFVLLIPTKELVFAPHFENPPGLYRKLVRAELRFRELTKEFLEAHDVRVVDALPVLRAELLAGRQPYPVDSDGHPNAAGHLAIAELVAEL